MLDITARMDTMALHTSVMGFHCVWIFQCNCYYNWYYNIAIIALGTQTSSCNLCQPQPGTQLPLVLGVICEYCTIELTV